MNNEPVAWMDKDGWLYKNLIAGMNWIPIYTHPAKTLTDEEIKQVWQANLVTMGNDLDFARAILRKAQEK